jgi:hypothetical protein
MALNPPGGKISLLNAGTTTGSTTGRLAPGSDRTYQATAVASTGTGNLVVQIQGSMDNSAWDTIGTITLTSASTAGMSDGFSSQDRYFWVRPNITTLSSNVTTSVYLGY